MIDYIVGDLVTRIDDVAWDTSWWRCTTRNVPLFGRIYTVRRFVDHPNGELGVYLEEVRNDTMLTLNGHHEPTFNSIYFRKVRKPNISNLRELLNPINHKQLELT